jgi:predicted peroxiredoxin
MRFVGSSVVLVVCGMFLGCDNATPVATSGASSDVSSAGQSAAIVLVSVQSDVNENPQSIDMAMKLAGFSLDEGRKVAMFFNVKGVHIPTKAFGDDVKFKNNDPIKAQLEKLIERGVEVHVCPVCMAAFDIQAGDIMDGAFVTTRPRLFENIGHDTSVFTY